VIDINRAVCLPRREDQLRSIPPLSMDRPIDRSVRFAGRSGVRNLTRQVQPSYNQDQILLLNKLGSSAYFCITEGFWECDIVNISLFAWVLNIGPLDCMESIGLSTKRLLQKSGWKVSARNWMNVCTF